ncbi:MAG: hypothetical protein NVS2B17_15940 [Candidatus Velthaea sp.]
MAIGISSVGQGGKNKKKEPPGVGGSLKTIVSVVSARAQLTPDQSVGVKKYQKLKARYVDIGVTLRDPAQFCQAAR